MRESGEAQEKNSASSDAETLIEQHSADLVKVCGHQIIRKAAYAVSRPKMLVTCHRAFPPRRVRVRPDVSRSRFLGQPKLEFPPVLAYDAGSVDKPFANDIGG
ncbi:protein of unknown function [Methylocella tundrae]|uniref:Uncharacterized protein n=1 Tax=Methylocella tundrae TaxID=227605 RepID=A0A4U8YXV2_METTU|nr:hypothetical protein [Methylocella tundrae]WPP05420.1 hypothetical protein SIN04_06235 [Methylocella tundrae]VFU07822.1 protein of unknown function [Methylocella tundrae]